MPHTSRRIRNQPKRRTKQTSDDGWTHITYTSSRPSAGSAIASHHRSAGPFYTQDQALTPAKLSDEFQSYLSRYRASTCRAAVSSLVQSRLGHERRVDTAVCLALGAVAREELRWRSMWQLAAFVDLASTLEDATGTKIRMALQEPWLLPLDGPFLESIGIELLDAEREEALELMGAGTVVFAPFMEREVEGRYLARAGECRAWIGTGLGERDWTGEGEEMVRARAGAERLRKGFEEVRWPVGQEMSVALEGLFLYLRREEEVEEG